MYSIHRLAEDLRAATQIWDAAKNRELVAQRITERLARAPFHLIASANGYKIAIDYRPTPSIDAIWQQFAREAASIIRCAKRPDPNCRCWVLPSRGQSNRQ